MTRSSRHLLTFATALCFAALAACGSTVPAGTTRFVADGTTSGGNGALSTDGDATDGFTTVDGQVVDSNGNVVSSPGATRTTQRGSGSAAAQSGPIAIGVVLTDPGTTEYQGVSTGQTLTEQQIDDALFKAINAQGGINGRQVKPVYAPTHTSSTNWATDFAAACATFTQDNKVQAVLGYVFNYDQSFESCLTRNRIPHLMNGFNVPDKQELAKNPLHRSLAVPTIDDRSILKLKNAIADGFLTKSNKLGVLVDGCPGTEHSWKTVAKPYLDSKGIKYEVLGEGGDCPTGNNSGTANTVAGVPNQLLKLRQEGVDALTFLTVSEGPVLFIVASAAEPQGYRPKYIVSSLANLSALESQLPAAQAKNVRGYGWLPSQDVGAGRQPARDAVQQRCLSLLKTQGAIPQEFGDFANAYRICEAVFAYEAAVKATNGNTTGANVVAALDGLGNRAPSPYVLNGATVFGPGRENSAPSQARALTFNDGGFFEYVGPTRPLP